MEDWTICKLDNKLNTSAFLEFTSAFLRWDEVMHYLADVGKKLVIFFIFLVGRVAFGSL